MSEAIAFNELSFPGWLAGEISQQRITQKEVAERTGISPQAICAYIKGERFPSFSNLEEIMIALGYEINITRPGELQTIGINAAVDRVIQIIEENPYYFTIPELKDKLIEKIEAIEEEE